MRHFVLALLSICCVVAQTPQAKTTHVHSTPIWNQEPDGFKGLSFYSSEENAGARIGSCTKIDSDITACDITDSDIGSVGTHAVFAFQNDRFVSADGNFDSSNFEILRDIFIKRYGRPHEDQMQTVRNNAGGEFKNEHLSWVGKNVIVVLSKYGSTVIQGHFAVSLKSYLAEQVRRDEAAKKKAATAM